MLLGVLLLLLRGRVLPAALLYGLAVHARIYPIIYAPAIVLFLARRQLADSRGRQQKAASGEVRLVCAADRGGVGVVGKRISACILRLQRRCPYLCAAPAGPPLSQPSH
jgi:hypothetical protein